MFGRPAAHHPHHAAHAHSLHHAYSQMNPYVSPHMYGMMPGAAAAAALGMGAMPGMHERLKLEEEHRARLAREEERERELQREKERQLREQREREREQRDKEQREKELREKEMREKERQEREREMREREQQEKDRDMARERERLHHYSQQMFNSGRNLNLLGPMIPGLNSPMGMPRLQPHQLGQMYHSAPGQRQSPHGPMGLNLGMSGLNLPPPGVHSSSLNLSHHMQHPNQPPTSLILGHPTGVSVSLGGMSHSNMSMGGHLSVPSTVGLSHPGIPSTGLNLSHNSTGLNLSHPVSTSSPAGPGTSSLNLSTYPGSMNLSSNQSNAGQSQSLNLSQSNGKDSHQSNHHPSHNLSHIPRSTPPSSIPSGHYYPVTTSAQTQHISPRESPKINNSRQPTPPSSHYNSIKAPTGSSVISSSQSPTQPPTQSSIDNGINESPVKQLSPKAPSATTSPSTPPAPINSATKHVPFDVIGSSGSSSSSGDETVAAKENAEAQRLSEPMSLDTRDVKNDVESSNEVTSGPNSTAPEEERVKSMSPAVATVAMKIVEPAPKDDAFNELLLAGPGGKNVPGV